MRASGWTAGVAAMLLWLLCVALPALAAASEVLGAVPSGVGAAPAAGLLLVSAGWAAAVGLGAILLGWLPGRVLGHALPRQGFVPLALLVALPICLPAYLVFYAWWQSWPADSAAYKWAVDRRLIGTLRLATLYVSLVCWSWPIVAWCVAGATAASAQRLQELLRLDAAGPWIRLRARVRADGRGVILGGAIVFLIVLNNTTCFDLAEVFTVGNELRAVAALGGNSRDLLGAAAPAIAVTGAGAAAIWLLLALRAPELTHCGARSATGTWLGAAAIWLATVIVPFSLFFSRVGGAEPIRVFVDLYGAALARGLALALGTGAVAAIVMVGLAATWQDGRRWVRGLGHVQAVGWIAMALIPATLTATCLEAAYNQPLALGFGALTLSDLVYRHPVILLFGHLARFGAVAALFARWLVRQEPATLLAMRRLEGAEHLPGLVRASWPQLMAAVAATVAVVGVMSMGEIPVTAQLQPPGYEAISATILNDMHYQRPRTVMVAALAFVLVAGLAALGTGTIWWMMRRLSAPVAAPALLLLAAVTGLGGCGDRDAAAARPLPAVLVFGSSGLSLGQFNYPRGIAADRQRGRLFIVDKTARVQRFDTQGIPELQWRMPEMELGKPTGLNVAPDGNVYVADTHYFRVIAYDPSGTELLRFGRYGEGPGEFIYPTDVEFGPAGRLYVSEYGGNDRIQVFEPDGTYVFEFGGFGSGTGEFNRPQSMVFDEERRELFIADACNHRIVVVDAEGRWLRSFGEAGREAGQLLYPYDLVLLPDGTLVVCEFGNNRLQQFTRDGRSLAVMGRLGAGPGELKYPWGVDLLEDRLFVLDSGNNRVQVFPRP